MCHIFLLLFVPRHLWLDDKDAVIFTFCVLIYMSYKYLWDMVKLQELIRYSRASFELFWWHQRIWSNEVQTLVLYELWDCSLFLLKILDNSISRTTWISEVLCAALFSSKQYSVTLKCLRLSELQMLSTQGDPDFCPYSHAPTPTHAIA